MAIVALSFGQTRYGGAQGATGAASEVWRFDRIDHIGGYPTTIVGHPSVVPSSYGSVVRFDGVSDGLFVEDHPLAGADIWTWEVIFEPNAHGAAQQRFFHLSSMDREGRDSSDRMLFEIRIVDGQWCLDSFAMSGDQKLALLDCRKRYPLGQWYRVSAVYDGRMLRNYVGDELQGEGMVRLAAQGPGRSSIGTRINRQDFFSGDIYESRFTREALSVDRFLPMPQVGGR